MTPEQQARLDELRRKAAAAAVPPESVSSPVNPPAAPATGIQNPPTLTPEQQQRLEVLRRKQSLGQGDAGAVLPAVGAQVAEGTVTGAGTMAGAIAGAKGGAMLGSPAGPAGAAIGGATGFVVGAVAGAVAGDMAFRPVKDILIENGYMYPSIADAPGEVRPYLYGGTSLGGSISGIGAMNFLAQSSLRMAPSTVGRFVNGTLDALKARPVVQNVREGLAATGAAAGVTAAATQTEDPWLLLGAELTGGIAGSSSVGVRLLDYVVRGSNRIAQRFLSSSQETEAGRIIADVFRRYGEDPAQTGAALQDMFDNGLDEGLPAGYWLESPAYRAMQNFLATQDSEAAGRIKGSVEKWFEVQARMVSYLRRTGDPKDLVTAARVEQDLMDQFVTSSLNDARESVIESMQGLTRMDALDRQRLSVALTDKLLEVNDKFRAEEARLWSAIDRDLESPIDVFVQGMDALKGQYTPELQSLASPIIKQFLHRISGRADETTEDALLAGLEVTPGLREFVGGLTGASEAPDPPKLWELQQMRSLVLNLQRAASSGEAANPTLASYYGDVSQVLLLQIEAAMPAGMDEAYDAARNFTKAYHDVFTRSFVGDTTAVKRTGAAKLDPELMIRRATTGGPEATALRFREMEEAVQFLPGRGLDDPENALAIADMQNRIVRSFAAETLDAAGRIARPKAEKFLRDHAVLLERFPEVRDELTTALQSDDALRRLEDGFKEVDAIRAELPGLNRALDVDSAATAVSGAMSHPTQPIRQFTALARDAAERDPKAARALLAATMDWATGPNGDADIAAQLRALTSPIGRFSGRAPGGGDGPSSPVRILYETGVIDLEELSRIELMAERVATIMARASDRSIAAGVEGPDSILDTLIVNNVRFAGAVAGTQMRPTAGGGAGVSLQAAQQGANLFAKVFDKMPQQKVRQLILRAIEDPRLMVELLKKARTPSEQLAVTKQAMAYILPAFGSAITGDDGIQLDFGSDEE